MENGKAEKGSQYWLQEFVNDDAKRDVLSNQIISTSPSLIAFGVKNLTWKSPLKKENYYEYRDDFLDALDLDDTRIKDIKNKLSNFWPKNGPQWDGIALTETEKKGIILLEAKAHPAETKSSISASSEISISKIGNSIKNVQSYMGLTVNIEAWTKNHYQLANRISYLYFLNTICQLPTWLVLVNFIDDYTHKPTKLDDWIIHYNESFAQMNINDSSKLLDKIIMIYPAAVS